MRFHSPANAPNFRDVGVAQHPVALEGLANIDNPSRLRLQSFCRVVGQLAQGFCAGNAYPDRNKDTAATAHRSLRTAKSARWQQSD